MGGGFSISKNLNKRKAAKKQGRVLGRKRTESMYPANSSITICLLSFSPNIFSAQSAAAVPAMTNTIRRDTCAGKDGFKDRKKRNAAREAKVPGANGRYPIKPRVAIFFSTAGRSIYLDYHTSG